MSEPPPSLDLLIILLDHQGIQYIVSSSTMQKGSRQIRTRDVNFGGYCLVSTPCKFTGVHKSGKVLQLIQPPPPTRPLSNTISNTKDRSKWECLNLSNLGYPAQNAAPEATVIVPRLQDRRRPLCQINCGPLQATCAFAFESRTSCSFTSA